MGMKRDVKYQNLRRCINLMIVNKNQLCLTMTLNSVHTMSFVNDVALLRTNVQLTGTVDSRSTMRQRSMKQASLMD